MDDEETCLEGSSSREKQHRGINELGFNEDDTKQRSHLNSLLSLPALLSTLFCYIFSSCIVVVLIQRTYAQKYFAMLDSAFVVILLANCNKLIVNETVTCCQPYY